jgi:hypothetical protein
LYLRYAYGWLEFRRNTDTPNEFLSHTSIRRDKYTKDSVEAVKQLRTFLGRHEDFFYSKAYFDSTEVIIDSIVYGPGLDKLAVLVIAKNPTYRQLMPDKNNFWYYDATCYLGVRKNDSIVLSWIGPVFTGSFDERSIANDIREACFRTFVTKDTSDAYEYNLNDIRFWNSSIWKKIEEEKVKRKSVEDTTMLRRSGITQEL